MSTPKCPYCQSHDQCEHLLLRVDLTFLEAEEGTLLDGFNDRWTAIYDSDDDGFDEIVAFRSLMEEAKTLSDSVLNYVIEGPPGMSPACSAYYCSSKERTYAAVRKFAQLDR